MLKAAIIIMVLLGVTSYPAQALETKPLLVTPIQFPKEPPPEDEGEWNPTWHTYKWHNVEFWKSGCEYCTDAVQSTPYYVKMSYFTLIKDALPEPDDLTTVLLDDDPLRRYLLQTDIRGFVFANGGKHWQAVGPWGKRFND